MLKALFLGLSLGVSCVVSAARPNVVVILADDMGLGDVAAYTPTQGDNAPSVAKRLQAQTPHLDRLAREGMRFTNAHTPSSVCTPTRYGLLTGRHPCRSVRGLGVQSQYGDLFLHERDGRTLADVVRQAGYRTAFIGKWHLGYEVVDRSGATIKGAPTDPALRPDWSRGLRRGPADHGFDFSFGHVASADIPPYKWFLNDGWAQHESVWTTGAEEFGVDLMREGWRDPDWDPRRVTRVLRDQATAYLRGAVKADEKPFYLHFCLSSPHSPTAPHPDFQGTTPGSYTDYVAEVDDVVGAILAAIDETGIASNTLIVFTSDNGPFEGMVQRDGKNPGHEAAGFLRDRTGGVKEVRGQKFTAYEGGHRVPFLVRWGDGAAGSSTTPPGAVNDDLVNLQDLYRTVAALAGGQLTESEGVDSFDLAPHLTGTQPVGASRRDTFSTSGAGVFSITARDHDGAEWKLVYSPDAGRNGNKAIDPRRSGVSDIFDRLQLFNLTDDVGESRNLLNSDNTSPAHRDKAAELHALLVRRLAEGRSFPQ